MKSIKHLSIVVLFCCAIGSPSLVASNLSVQEQLGYSSDARLLIVHADDIGMSHSVNQATFHAMREGTVNSGSIMVPCPWFPEAASYFKQHPELDLGLHLTLTAEWQDFKWSALSGNGQDYSLHNELGYMYADVLSVVNNANPADVEQELIAQIEQALAIGIQPTHLDSHMGTLFATEAFFQAYVKVGRQFKLPILLPRALLHAQRPELLATLRTNEILIDQLEMAEPDLEPEAWDAYYTDIIKNLSPGITEIIIHAGFSDKELNAVTINHPDYGSRWRHRDTDYFAKPQVADLLKEHDVHLVTWRELGKILYPSK